MNHHTSIQDSETLNNAGKLRFKKHDSIGGNDAEQDQDFLLNCFIDLGDMDQIVDFNNPKCLLLGRTGAGKTALITKLKADHESRVIVIDPEALAMQYISNSTIVKQLMTLGIDMNVFFKYLWRHVICVEIFNRHVKVTSETDHSNFIERIRAEFGKREPKHLKALDYLNHWKNTFWKTSESHVTAMVTKTEKEITSGMGLSSEALHAKLGGSAKLSAEEQRSFKQLGQSIVNDLQMKEVTGLLDMLNDFVEYHQSRYYVVIDGLDEKWVGNSMKNELIKSLIETVKDLNKFSSIKPVVVLRYDLMNRVFDISKDSAFQAEKYDSLYLDIRWSKPQLIELVNERINHLLSNRYSKKKTITHTDILPELINGKTAIDYIIDRTLMRPRDVIEFINYCIKEVSLDIGVISEETVLEAEFEYSQSRINALAYEWFTDYPGLKTWIKIFKFKPSSFKIGSITEDEVLELATQYIESPPETDYGASDELLNKTTNLIDSKISSDRFKFELIDAFYKMNVVGLKNNENRTVSWLESHKHGIGLDEINNDTEVFIHPCYAKALNVLI